MDGLYCTFGLDSSFSISAFSDSEDSTSGFTWGSSSDFGFVDIVTSASDFSFPEVSAFSLVSRALESGFFF